MKGSTLNKAFVFGALLIGTTLVWQGSYIKLKATVADWLISSSWAKRSAGQAPDKPWPWADTRVIARLSVARLNIQQYVMQDTSGESLAFGPGSMKSSDLPSEQAYAIIAGHRDTHFKFLAELKQGDLIQLENYLGQHNQYRVSDIRVINIDQDQLYIDPDSEGLTLITCWPFDALVPGGPERYLVEAEMLPDSTPYPDGEL